MEFKAFWLKILDMFQGPVNKMTVIMKLAAMGPISIRHGVTFIITVGWLVSAPLFFGWFPHRFQR
jgi:hypothetical protein